MSLPVRYLPEARDELAEAADFYESQRPGKGATLLAEIEAFGMRMRRVHAADFDDQARHV